MKIIPKHWLSFEIAQASNFEHPQCDSMTVPDMTLSIRELIEKHTVGQPVAVSYREPVYNGDVFVPNFASLDLAEREELAEQYKDEAEEHRQTQKKQFAERKAREKIEADELAERNRLLDEFKNEKSKKSDSGKSV